jgi:hypothetical protein
MIKPQKHPHARACPHEKGPSNPEKPYPIQVLRVRQESALTKAMESMHVGNKNCGPN